MNVDLEDPIKIKIPKQDNINMKPTKVCKPTRHPTISTLHDEESDGQISECLL